MDSTLMKGLTILDRAVAMDGPVSVSSLARELGLAKSSVHRSLSTLREAGYLLFNEDDRRYYPSLKLAQMGLTVSAHFPYRRAVLPYLERLTALTGETAHFAILEGSNAVFIASSVPRTTMASVIPDNFTLPWHKTSFGIAAVSAIPTAAAQALADDPAVHPVALETLEEARDCETAAMLTIKDRGTFEIAVAIRTSWRTTMGVIGISGPIARFDETRIPDQLADVRQIAAETFLEAKRAAGSAEPS